MLKVWFKSQKTEDGRPLDLYYK